MVTGQTHVAREIEEILKHRGLTAVFPVQPKFPLFDGIADPKIRALIAIALGCDALPGGVPGVGTTSLHNLLGACNWNNQLTLLEELSKKLANQNKATIKDANALLCLVNSLIYEKTNSEVGYMYNIPASIERYNEAFAAEETQIVDGPTVIICKGCDGHEHAFLEAEGVSTCVKCKARLCRFCIWDESNEDGSQVLCFECKRYSIAGKDDQMTEQDMRVYLREHAVNVPVAATYAEVRSLFKQFDDDEHAIFSDDIGSVRYPLLPSSTLNISHESSVVIERMKTVSVREIGALIQSDDVEPAMVIGLVHLLASLADITPRKKGNSLSYIHTVSQNLVSMAKNACIHSSQRLLERSLRHATDQASPDIFDGQLTLGRCNGNECVGEVCIIIQNNVRASMKNVEYKAKSAITHRHFLATECNCRAGCSNEPSPTVDHADVGGGRVICSHGMTLPVSLSLALYRGLAAHSLSELRLRLLHDGLEDSIGREQLITFRRDVSRLMKAAGITETAMDPTKSVAQCLDMFSVGTDLPKKPPSPPKSHDLGLLRDKCRYERCVQTAEQIVLMKEEVELDDIAVDLSTQMAPTLAEEYMSGQLALDALSVLFGRPDFTALSDHDDVEESFPIGFELLRDRASQHLVKLEYNERNISTMKVVEQWEMTLLQWTTVCGRYRRRFQQACVSPVVQSTISKKRKADEEVTNEWKGYQHKVCCVDGCNARDSELKRVADMPAKLPCDASRKRQITFAKKRFIRQERTERLGFGRHCDYKDLRACKNHWVPVEGKRVGCKIRGEDGTTVLETFAIKTFLAPVRVGEKCFGAPPVAMSKGNATDRATFRHVLEISQNEHALAQQQILEMQDVKVGEQALAQINPIVLPMIQKCVVPPKRCLVRMIHGACRRSC